MPDTIRVTNVDPAQSRSSSGLPASLQRSLPSDPTSPLAQALVAEFHSVVLVFGIPDSDAVMLEEAARLAVLKTRATESARAWAQATENRRRTGGKRPGLRQAERS